MVSILSRYFHVEGVENEGDKCEALIKLVNRDLADISINAPNIKLRRINQELPFQLSNFPTNRMEITAMLMSHYGKRCLQSPTKRNHFKEMFAYVQRLRQLPQSDGPMEAYF